jgi:hypothetical protein
MDPQIVPRPVYDRLAELAVPTDAEVAEAKAVILRRLANGRSIPAQVDQHLGPIVAEMGLGEISQPNREVFDTTGLEPGDLDRDAPALRRVRLTAAVRVALATLAAQGLVVAAESSYLMVPVRHGGTSGSERVDFTTPVLQGSYALTPGLVGDPGALPLLTIGAFREGLGDLLNERALRCLDEALGCARRGLYLSAANLLGAVSEAAWYRVGEAFRGRDDELESALDGNRFAQVLRLVDPHLRQVRANGTAINEVRAHAEYLRDLRNYGVHPVEQHAPSQEHAFTEVGALLLVYTTHHYLTRLFECAEAAGVRI